MAGGFYPADLSRLIHIQLYLVMRTLVPYIAFYHLFIDTNGTYKIASSPQTPLVA